MLLAAVRLAIFAMMVGTAADAEDGSLLDRPGGKDHEKPGRQGPSRGA